MTRNAGGTEKNEYIYDNPGRMTNELFKINNSNQWGKGYTFDYYNNIATSAYTDYISTANDTITTDTYNNANQLTNQLIKYDTTTLHNYNFEYDTAGNLQYKKEGTTTQMAYGYDALNRMSTSTPAGGYATTYSYDANGQRVGKTTNGTSTTSIWEGGMIAEDFITTGETTTKNIYLQGVFTEGVIKPFVGESGFEEFSEFYINAFSTGGDVATTWLIGSDTVSSNYNFDAYGKKTSGGALPSPYSYNGYYSDIETGLFYLNARYYDPSTQRFTQEDTYWGDNSQMNLYGYCGANPVMFTDPSGHNKTLRNGSRGDGVKTLQGLLNDHGAGLAVDGIFGPKTKAAVKSYQAAKGLAVDGIVGPQTWGSLIGGDSSGGGSSQSTTNNQIVSTAIKVIASIVDISSSATAAISIAKIIEAEKYVLQKNISLLSQSKVFTAISSVLAVIGIGIEVAYNIYINMQNGASLKRIVSDALVDTILSGGSILASSALGACVGNIFLPIYGGIAGAIAAAGAQFAIKNLIIDGFKYDGTLSGRQLAKNTVYYMFS